MPRPQLVTAAGVLLVVVGANVALGGLALSVLLFRAPASPCLCLACPFAVGILLAGVGCLRLGGLVLSGQLEAVASVGSVAAGVGGLLAFTAGAFLANELPTFVTAARPRTLQYTLEVGAVALACSDGIALVVAGVLLTASRHRYADRQLGHAPPRPTPDSSGGPLPADPPRP